VIVLVGFMGAGKTTLGAALAQRLGLPFVDTDDVIAARHGPIADIFASAGEATFRDLEEDAIRETLTGPQAVVSLGGGAVETPAVRDLLAGHEVIWLRISLQDALARLGDDPSRPVLNSANLAARFAARQPLYAQVATKIADAMSADLLDALDVT
jgi:shikimate kinase